MPTFRDVAEGGTYGIVVGAMAWVASLLRRATHDTETRAASRIGDVEQRLAAAEKKAGDAVSRAEACEEREHLLRLELIDAGIDIPKEPPG